MQGAVLGDIMGSVYERAPVKTKEIELFRNGSRFTDDTVLTFAVAEAILTGEPYAPLLKSWARRYPNAGYGQRFVLWFLSADFPQGNSFGNGSAMRVSPVGWAFDDLETVLAEAARSAEPTHNHPEAIAAAQTVAGAIFLARSGQDKEAIRRFAAERLGCDMTRTVEEIRPGYRFSSAAAQSVPEAVIAFLDSTSFEDAVRNAISLGGDADTQACIAGALAEAFYGPVPDEFATRLKAYLPPDGMRVMESFVERYCGPARRRKSNMEL